MHLEYRSAFEVTCKALGGVGLCPSAVLGVIAVLLLPLALGLSLPFSMSPAWLSRSDLSY